MPKTLDDLIASIEVEKEAAEKRHAKNLKETELILAKATQDGRSNLTEEETGRVQELEAARDQAKQDIAGASKKLENALEIKAEEDERMEATKQVTPTNTRKPAYDQTARVGQEERTYTKEKDRYGREFFTDVCRQFLYQDIEAGHRLSRHIAEERVERSEYMQRAVGTGAFAGLTVPQYLTELYAPATAALRPFADVCNPHPLPADGMSVNISRITTASGVGLQASENAAVTETNMDDTLLTVNVQTAGGQQTISRQAIDRGTGIEDIVMQDLFKRYATNLDSTLLNQATNGLSAVSVDNTFTTPVTAAGLYPKVLGAQSAAEAALLAQAVPNYAVMHSRRWYWLSKELGSTWPFINSQGIPVQAGGVSFNQSYDGGIRGMLPNGLAVVVDNNIATNGGAGTNQDEVYVVAADECHLWEDPDAPVFIRAEQPAAASLGVLLVLYGYFAYTFARYTGGTQKITGAGLITPSF
jgi:HK97 family phage major capsid protein